MCVLEVIMGLPRAAGTSVFCGEVSNQLVAKGHDVTIALTNPRSADTHPLDARVHLAPFADVFSDPNPRYELMHVHGLWSLPLHKSFCWACARGLPVIWSTHGMTAPWSLRHKWWKKLVPWLIYQKRDLIRADLIHCTSDFEVEWNRKLGLTRTFHAPLGTSFPLSTLPRRPNEPPRILLYVGRIYPVKAIDKLIQAFAITQRSLSSVRARTWTLRLVGPDQADYMLELMSLCNRLGLTYSKPNGMVISSSQYLPSSTLFPNVQFVGARYKQDLESEYENCDALALVSHTENFGATVVEAMAHGKPVLTSTTTPWRIVSDRNCGFWVENRIDSLSSAMTRLFETKDEDLANMGKKGLMLVKERYTWHSVSRLIEEAYTSILKR